VHYECGSPESGVVAYPGYLYKIYAATKKVQWISTMVVWTPSDPTKGATGGTLKVVWSRRNKIVVKKGTYLYTLFTLS